MLIILLFKFCPWGPFWPLSLCWRHSQVSGDSLWLFTFEREALKATRVCGEAVCGRGYGWRAVMQGDLYTCLEVSFGDPRMLRSWTSFPWSVGPSREDNSCSVSRWKRGQGLPAAPRLALVILSVNIMNYSDMFSDVKPTWSWWIFFSVLLKCIC